MSGEELYIYETEDGGIGITTERFAEHWNVEARVVPAAIWLATVCGDRTAALWWSAMVSRDTTRELRWTWRYRVGEHFPAAVETWPEHVEDALAMVADRQARLVVEELMELSFTEAEREAVSGGSR